MIGQKASVSHHSVAYDFFGAEAAFAENIIDLAAPFAITVKRIDQPAGEVGIFLRHPLQNGFGLLVKVAANQNFLFVCRAAEYQGKPFFSRSGIGIVEVRRKQRKRAVCAAKIRRRTSPRPEFLRRIPASRDLRRITQPKMRGIFQIKLIFIVGDQVDLIVFPRFRKAPLADKGI